MYSYPASTSPFATIASAICRTRLSLTCELKEALHIEITANATAS